MKKLLLALFFLAFATCADAATCFWVGGTGSWSTANAASWASGTGGTASTCAATGGIPKQAGDVATFDALSGGGTVTVDSTMNGTTIQTITMGAFTGTLDFSVNNPNMTLGSNGNPAFDLSGTGARTIKFGSGTYTLKSTSNNNFNFTTITSLVFTGGTATFSFADNGTANGIMNLVTGTPPAGAFATNTFVLGSLTSGGIFKTNVTFTVGTVQWAAGPGSLMVASGTTLTITNAIAWTGAQSALIAIMMDNVAGTTTKGTLALAAGSTIAWSFMEGIAVTGLTLSASNSYNGGNNSGITLTAPSGGGGGHIIGG